MIRTISKLCRTPYLSSLAVVTLALGIGANTAVFSLVNGILLTPLPIPDPDRLVSEWYAAPGLDMPELYQSPALHATLEEEGRAFKAVGMWTPVRTSVSGLEGPEEITAIRLTANTQTTLGIQPFLGRRFATADDSPSGPNTTILSYEYWQDRFSGDPGVLGQTIRIGGVVREIIGVMPRELDYLDLDPSLFLPFRLDRTGLSIGQFSFRGVARLAAGVTLREANEDVARVVPLADERYPGGVSLEMLEEAQFAPVLRPLKEDVVGGVGQVLWVLLGTMGMVLLLACANVANLFLVRAEGREQEMAIRKALGARQGQIAKGLLAESVTVGVLGGMVGIGLA
jgi:predicted permease